MEASSKSLFCLEQYIINNSSFRVKITITKYKLNYTAQEDPVWLVPRTDNDLHIERIYWDKKAWLDTNFQKLKTFISLPTTQIDLSSTP